MRIVLEPLAKPVAAWLDFLARSGEVEPTRFAQRRVFVAIRLAAGLAILAFTPPWLYFNGIPSARQAVLYLLMQTPLVAVATLARTGDLRLAQRISIFGWAALAVGVEFFLQGSETLSLGLLGLAVVEAAMTLEMSTMVFVLAIVIVLVAVDTIAEPASLASPYTRTDLASRLAPLLLYFSAIATAAIVVEQARKRKELRAARDLALLTEALGDIVAHFDRSGVAMHIVGDLQRNYGLNKRDFLGRGFFQRVHVADRPAFLKLISDTCANIASDPALLRLNVGALENVERGFIEPVYSCFEARSRAISVDAVPEPHAVCILRDVTSAQKVEEAMVAAQREAQRANAAKTKFLATISHELRTPLNAIIGFAEMLASAELEPKEPPQRRDYARIVAESGRHLHEVVNTLLDMSKIESGAMELLPEPFCLAALVSQCCDMIKIKADQGRVRLLREFPRELDEIVADRRACKQIAINLLSNAVKFTPPNGEVCVCVSLEGAFAVLRVSDTGVGIAAADLARLGDPFFQASSSHDRHFEGTGLGLCVVRGLVGLHGGAIAIESGVRAGTTVTVRLPRDGRAAQERSPAAAKIETIARHGVAAPGLDLAHDKGAVKKIA
ncbi:MAG TPA: HAMP domain-containing sensor histidine kinase [Methylocystis sp.]|nr:HAMP domain-containing sensor histidine kinase [Methylocystis sp.]